MRKLDDHIITPDDAKVEITVIDEPGAGGANHAYEIALHSDNYPGGKLFQWIGFQNGPIAEAGVNGITQEVLLTIVIDRLRSFQKGAYACRENAVALTKIEEALHWLQQRTIKRVRAGVEGTSGL